jgi:hypothetical protein
MQVMLPPRRHGPAKALNPYAGDHIVTAEPRELEAARSAGAESLARFPYLVARYASRGGAFTTSDGAWIVTLVERGPAHRREEVDWLASVLFHRGMPRRMLEVYLPRLAAELTGNWPERGEEYRVLVEEGERLAAERRAVLPDAVFDAVDREFVRRATPGAPFDPRGTGELLAGGVADEACGHGASLEKIRGWLSDPARFPVGWLGAVHEAVREARAALVGR